MKNKLIKITLALALIVSAFFVGMKVGERNVILGQDIWTDGVYMFSEYMGEVHYYD